MIVRINKTCFLNVDRVYAYSIEESDGMKRLCADVGTELTYIVAECQEKKPLLDIVHDITEAIGSNYIFGEIQFEQGVPSFVSVSHFES